MMHIFTHTEWRDVVLEDAASEQCSACDGEGGSECEKCDGEGVDFCDSCSSETNCNYCDQGVVPCDQCDGTGCVDTSFAVYRRQLIYDAYSLAAFTGREPLSVIGDFVKSGAAL